MMIQYKLMFNGEMKSTQILFFQNILFVLLLYNFF